MVGVTGIVPLSCINHISALFYQVRYLLVSDNAALSSPRKTLLTFSFFNTYNFDCKEVSECERGSGQTGCVLSRVVGSLFVFLTLSRSAVSALCETVCFIFRSERSIGYICLTIPLRPAYSIHRRRICVDIALVLCLSHALRRAFGKGSSPGRRFGRFCESGSARYVGYASFFLTTTLHQTYNNLRIRICCHIAHRRWLRLCWVGILLQEESTSDETSAEVLPLGMSPTLSKDVSSFHSSNRSAKRQAPASSTPAGGLTFRN